MNASRFPAPVPTLWIARNPERPSDIIGFDSRDEAFAFWRDENDSLDYRQIDPDGHWHSLNDDFGEEHFADRREAREMRRHEAGLMAGRL